MTMIHSHAAPRGNVFANFGRGLLRFLSALAENNGRYRQVQYLHSLSDAQLAEKGLTRESIVHHVYRDMLYL